MRVLVVDDHPIVASGCRALFADEPEIELLEASDAENGERVFVEERPDRYRDRPGDDSRDVSTRLARSSQSELRPQSHGSVVAGVDFIQQSRSHELHWDRDHPDIFPGAHQPERPDLRRR